VRDGSAQLSAVAYIGNCFVDEVTMICADEPDAIVGKLHNLSFRGVFMIVYMYIERRKKRPASQK
jgi:hypothetical protein